MASLASFKEAIGETVGVELVHKSKADKRDHGYASLLTKVT